MTMMIYKNPFVNERLQGENLFLVFDNKIHLLTGIAPFIWEHVGLGCSDEEILEKILEEYDVKEVKARKDLISTIKKLEKIDVLETKQI